jgi:hypothetical protein
VIPGVASVEKTGESRSGGGSLGAGIASSRHGELDRNW